MIPIQDYQIKVLFEGEPYLKHQHDRDLGLPHISSSFHLPLVMKN